MPSDIEIAKVLTEWKRVDCVVEINDSFGLEMSVLFDHDYEFHVLFYEHDRNISDSGFAFSLWFIGIDGVTLVKRWPDRKLNGFIPPFAECGEIVQGWREMASLASEIEYGK